MPIRIVTAPLSIDELRGIAAEQFGDFVKAVVDVGQGVMAIGKPTSGGSTSIRTDRQKSASNSIR